MNRDEAYKIAVEMFKREHDRWIQNAVVLFGAVVSVLLLYFNTSLKGNSWAALVVSLVSATISAMIVCVALSIRATTDAWRFTISAISRLPYTAEDVEPVCGELLISPESAIRHTHVIQQLSGAVSGEAPQGNEPKIGGYGQRRADLQLCRLPCESAEPARDARCG